MSALLSIATATKNEASALPAWIPVAALVAGVFALIGIALNRYSERQDRRRSLYADAYKAALAWVEMLYRVRRRDPNNPYALADQFHCLQESIDFHQAWIESESVHLGRAYRKLVASVKKLTVQEIKAAWKAPPCSPDDGFSLAEGVHPPIDASQDQFIVDLREHMSANPFSRRRMRQRYADQKPSATAPPPTAPTSGGTK
jgi:hypothetical protein